MWAYKTVEKQWGKRKIIDLMSKKMEKAVSQGRGVILNWEEAKQITNYIKGYGKKRA